ncbi:hypothetical protein JDV09_23610 [Mycobacterium sp. Y57]|uniref:hypothetical protein n=1 Tax=Mycolicibacterium xanthum TaxID=2796469 RepID=UPI001C848672|nr:hypothetical protein [Mycolicibacterium xanthum]MBX7435061.1 hypothetical protein [Mycolicibacterium xanthum]
MTAARVLCVLAGVAGVGYGALLLWDNSPTVLLRIAVWAAVGVVVHDFVFAPLCAAAGLAGRRLIPARWLSPVAIAALCSVVLVALAIPVYGRPGMRPDNPTVLNRDYPTGFWIALGIVWACVPLYYLLTRLLPVGQDQAVERERTDDVERQPPP